MKENLTDQQQLFLEVLFSEAGGDALLAKRLAGYAESYPVSRVVKTLEEEIIAATKLFLSRNGPKAAIKIAQILDDPSEPGTKERLAAAKDLLDRVGVSKTEKIELGGSGIFILPAKEA